MTRRVNRREFVKSSAAAAGVAALSPAVQAQGPTVMAPKSVAPVRPIGRQPISSTTERAA